MIGFKTRTLMCTLVVFVLVCAQNAQALMIRNVTQNTILFRDGFENNSTPPDPAVVGGATVGTWSSFNPDARIGDLANDGIAAVQGSRYLVADHTGDKFAHAFMDLDLSSAVNDDVIEMEFSYYQAGGREILNGPWIYYSTDHATDDVGGFGTVGDGGIHESGPGYGPTGSSLTLNTWHTLVLSTTVGTTDYALSVDGGAPIAIAGAGDIATANSVVFNRWGLEALFYIDAIPEPNSATLLMIAGLGVGLAGRRKRRS